MEDVKFKNTQYLVKLPSTEIIPFVSDNYMVSLTLSVPRGHPCPQIQMIHIFQLRAVKKIIFGLL